MASKPHPSLSNHIWKYQPDIIGDSSFSNLKLSLITTFGIETRLVHLVQIWCHCILDI